MTFNLDKCNNLLKNPPAPTTLRVFFWLALNLHPQTGFVRISTRPQIFISLLALATKQLHRSRDPL